MINPLDLTGKTILVTGASSGIGRETAILLSRLGAKVVLLARDKERLQETKKALSGSMHILCPLDLTNVEAINTKLSEICQSSGKLDGVAHCAGIQITMPLQFFDADSIHQIIETNLISTISLIKAFRQKSIANNPSSIVLLSSVTALVGQSGLSLYAATKGALLSLTRSLAMELSRQNIRINAILPGMVDTPMSQEAFKNMTPHQKQQWETSHLLGIGHPVDVANMVAFLLANTGRWITGANFIVDGGFTAFKMSET